MNDFERFLMDDDRARWRAILWSWLVGTAAGAMISASSMPIAILACVSLTASLLTFCAFVAAYLRASPHSAVTISSRREILNYAVAAGTTLAFFVLERTLTNPEAVHAAALRIRDSIGVKSLPERELTSVIAALGVIGGRSKDRAVSRDRLIADYAAVSAALAYNEVLKGISVDPNSSISNLTLDLLGPASAGIVANRSVLLNHPGVKAAYRFSNAVKINCTSCTVVVLQGSFENLTQVLDSAIWFKCHFKECHITYMGRKLVMFENGFENCTFEFATSVESELRSMIEAGTAVYPLPLS